MARSYDAILALRKVLVSESEPLARRFRALFSLKHFACFDPPTERTLPAIEAIAAGLTSHSALLKHELAYCLGQTRNLNAVPYLKQALEDSEQDVMCRHEAAEALGALGDAGSLDALKKSRDDKNEPEVIRETCDIAVDRILWENSDERKAERLKPRYVSFLLDHAIQNYKFTNLGFCYPFCFWGTIDFDSLYVMIIVTLFLSILPHLFQWPPRSSRFPTWRRPSLTQTFLCSRDTVRCLPCVILRPPQTCPRRFLPLRFWLRDSATHLPFSGMRLLSFSDNSATLRLSLASR